MLGLLYSQVEVTLDIPEVKLMAEFDGSIAVVGVALMGQNLKESEGVLGTVLQIAEAQ